MENYFKQYTSNSYAGCSNQLYFEMADGELRKGRTIYKISVPGEYQYSLLFSNVIDSTYADGTYSYHDLKCDPWKIHSARIGKCKYIAADQDVAEMTMADDEHQNADIHIFDWKEITFAGQKTKDVAPGEFFATDPITLNFEEGEYLCLEMTISGKRVPCHEETLIPVFVEENGEWKYSINMPLAGMIGCDRSVKARITYYGDSITQGVGTEKNSYTHWNAKLSEKLGKEYAYWNLGIGYGRASDAASDGAWIYKAKNSDIVFVCYGVNDLLRGRTAEQIKADLTHIVDVLKKEGKKIVLQTVPPFDYEGELIGTWQNVNDYIKTVLKERVDAFFDNVPILGEGEYLNFAKYGGHPDAKGCAIWADALFEEVGKLFK